jgi:hypothetical protein
MDIEVVIRRVIDDKIGDWTAHPSILGTPIADALADAGLAQLDGDQVADYIRELGDRTQLTSGDIAAALAEAIEEDLDEESAF